MLALQGRLSSSNLALVTEKTRILFQDPQQFKMPEAVIVHEQKLLPDDELLEACCEEYGFNVFTPKLEYIPRNLLDKFRNTNTVPIRYDASTSTMMVGSLPEIEPFFQEIYNIYVKAVRVPIHYYVDVFKKYYGIPSFMLPIPTKDCLDFIYKEALDYGASDITIYNTDKYSANVIYNVRKRLVHSNRSIGGEQVLQIAQLLSSQGRASFDSADEDPRFFSVRIDLHHRGRVVLNKTYHGWALTIRVLPDDYLNATLEDLNLSRHSCDFIRNVVLSSEKGLRIFIGETMSGKNTTILCGLLELVKQDRYKIVSVESPVEILVQGIIQLNSETEDSFAKNADSLLRQNPDIVYFTEMTEKTAYSIIKQSNTSKAVFSTVHANSVADVVSRLMDITQMDSDRIIQTLQSCVYQVLVRDDDKDCIYPVNRCVHFTDELKSRLYGLPLYEQRAIIKEEEDKWVSYDVT